MNEADVHGTFLVVDDDDDVRKVVCSHLQSAGFTVHDASSGAAAVNAFPTVRPDLVFLDVMMPAMDGFQTAEKIRALDGGATTSIVFLTAHGEIENFKKALPTNPSDFLTKPIARAALIDRARSLCKAKHVREISHLAREIAMDASVSERTRAQAEAIIEAARKLTPPKPHK